MPFSRNWTHSNDPRKLHYPTRCHVPRGLRTGGGVEEGGAAGMKAYLVFHRLAPEESLLVFAETRDKARAKVARDGPYDWAFEYLDVRARREKEWDEYAREEKIIEANDELPAGAPPFYDDEAW